MVARVDAALAHNAPQGAVNHDDESVHRKYVAAAAYVNKGLLCQRPTTGSYGCGHLMLTKSTILQALTLLCV